MIIKNLYLVTTLCLTLATLLDARIGETRAELVERFGEPTDEDPQLIIWELREGLAYGVTLDENGKSCVEMLTGDSITEADIKSLANANGPFHKLEPNNLRVRIQRQYMKVNPLLEIWYTDEDESLIM